MRWDSILSPAIVCRYVTGCHLPRSRSHAPGLCVSSRLRVSLSFICHFELMNDWYHWALWLYLLPCGLDTLSLALQHQWNQCVASSGGILHKTHFKSLFFHFYYTKIIRNLSKITKHRTFSVYPKVNWLKSGSKSLSRTFSSTIPDWWNDLPTPIRNAGSLSTENSSLSTLLDFILDWKIIIIIT